MTQQGETRQQQKRTGRLRNGHVDDRQRRDGPEGHIAVGRVADIGRQHVARQRCQGKLVAAPDSGIRANVTQE